MSRTQRITLAAVSRLRPGDTLWDSEIKGFGARCRADAVSYVFKKRVSGRQTWITIGRHGSPWTPDTARREALSLAADIANGDNPVAAKQIARVAPDVARAIEAFIAEHSAKVKASTADEYRKLIKRYLIPTFGRHKTDAITHAMVASAHAKWAEYPRAANHALAVLSAFMTWAEDRSLRPIGTNPCRRIKKYPERKRQRYLTRDELQRLGAAIDGAERSGRIRAPSAQALRLLLLTGARLSEILTLKWSYVDFERRLLNLPDSKTGQKVIHLSAAACAVLAAIPRIDGNPHVIVGHVGGTHLVDLHRPWSIVCALANLDDLRVHDLRHTFASVAVAEGGSLPILGKLLGHRQAQTTARYAHLADDPVQRLTETAGQAIADAIAGRPKP